MLWGLDLVFSPSFPLPTSSLVCGILLHFLLKFTAMLMDFLEPSLSKTKIWSLWNVVAATGLSAALWLHFSVPHAPLSQNQGI